MHWQEKERLITTTIEIKQEKFIRGEDGENYYVAFINKEESKKINIFSFCVK